MGEESPGEGPSEIPQELGDEMIAPRPFFIILVGRHPQVE